MSKKAVQVQTKTLCASKNQKECNKRKYGIKGNEKRQKYTGATNHSLFIGKVNQEESYFS